MSLVIVYTQCSFNYAFPTSKWRHSKSLSSQFAFSSICFKIYSWTEAEADTTSRSVKRHYVCVSCWTVCIDYTRSQLLNNVISCFPHEGVAIYMYTEVVHFTALASKSTNSERKWVRITAKSNARWLAQYSQGMSGNEQEAWTNVWRT